MRRKVSLMVKELRYLNCKKEPKFIRNKKRIGGMESMPGQFITAKAAVECGLHKKSGKIVQIMSLTVPQMFTTMA